MCTDSTCPTIIPEDSLQGERSSSPDPSTEELMRAPVAPQGSSGNGGRRGRSEKAGEREARLRIRRSIEDGPPAGGRDKTGAEKGCGRLGSKNVCVRMSGEDRERLANLVEVHGSVAQVVRMGLDAVEAIHCARVGDRHVEEMTD
jgi:hypothetical protein